MQITTHSETETKEFGKKLALGRGGETPPLQGGDVILLYGELGSGKTTFVKGLAEGLGITKNITSPTFTLMNIYKVQSPESRVQSLVHIDTYRLKNEHELIAIGAEDYIGEPDIVTVIEWPEKIMGLLKNKKVVNLTFDHGGSASERTITVE